MTAFGTVGEVFLVPDPSTRVYVPFDGSPAEYFFLGDIRTPGGAPWDFCPRQVLRRALAVCIAKPDCGCSRAFEQEFTYSGVPVHPPNPMSSTPIAARDPSAKRCSRRCARPE